MNEQFDPFLKAVRVKDAFLMGSLLEGMNTRDLLISLNTLGPDRRRDFLTHYSGPAKASIAAASEVLDNNGLSGDPALRFEATKLFQEYAARPPLTIADDPTGLLPAPNPAALKLSDNDFKTAAEDLGVEPAAVRAVSKVESGGRVGFDSRGRPKILFEAHIFQRYTLGRYQWTHPHLSRPSQKLGKAYYALDQWSRMYEAMLLDPVAAWVSASWGVFQVMGFNHDPGFPTIEEFVNAMFVSELNHLRAFLGYCTKNNLVKCLKNRDWAAFAKGYNGADYATNKYDTKMAAAYEQYNKVTTATPERPGGTTDNGD